MLHPLFSVLVQRPDLLVDHLAGYAGLMQQEAGEAVGGWVQRAVAWLAVAALALIFIGLSGVAIMLGALLERFHWALVGVPAAVLLAALVAYGVARRAIQKARFDDIRAQWQADVAALRRLKETGHG